MGRVNRGNLVQSARGGGMPPSRRDKHAVRATKTVVLTLALSARISAVVVLLAVLSAAEHKSAQANPEPRCQLVEQGLQNYQQLKVGLSRSDAIRYFVPDGGMQFPSSGRFVDPTCSYLHADIEFKLTKPDAILPSPDDKIMSISKLYVEYPAKD